MDAEKKARKYLVYKLTQMADAGPLGFDAETIREAARALESAGQGEACVCGLATCQEPWEPGCGLGNSEEHAVVAPQQPEARGVVDEVVQRVMQRLDKVADYAHTLDGEAVVIRLSSLAPVLTHALTEARNVR